jgi:long-chain acyl-CoA synthetase
MPEKPWIKSYPPGVSWEVEPPQETVYAILDDAIAKFGKNIALDFMDKKVSYDDLGDMVERAAKGFQDLGVGPGVHVGLFLPNTPHFVVCFFGVLKAGGTVVNYSPLDAEAELRHKIEDSETDILVTLNLNLLYPRMVEMLGTTRLRKLVVGGIQDFLPFPKNLLYPLVRKADFTKMPKDNQHISFKELLANDGRFERAQHGDLKEEVAVLQYTGGTTGVPKGAMLTHYNLVSSVTQFSEWGAGDDPVFQEGKDRVLTVLPLFHIYALTVVLLTGFAGGAELILHPRFELEDVMRDLAKKRPTMFPGVPTMYTAILAHPKVQEIDFEALVYCGTGGAPLPPELQRQFNQTTGAALVEGWGMTETCSVGVATPIRGVSKAGSAGIPLPGANIEFTDVDEPEKLLPYGERGEICVTGPSVLKGYWNKEEETAEAFAGGRFHTGDIGYMDEDGYLFIVDRKKDMILSGGFNVYPRNIEDAIYQHDSVSECTVIGVADEYRGQAAKAFVVLKEGAAAFTLEELREFLGDKIGKHELPAHLEIRDELPKTPIGKLSKKELYAEEEAKAKAAG